MEIGKIKMAKFLIASNLTLSDFCVKYGFKKRFVLDCINRQGKYQITNRFRLARILDIRLTDMISEIEMLDDLFC